MKVNNNLAQHISQVILNEDEGSAPSLPVNRQRTLFIHRFIALENALNKSNPHYKERELTDDQINFLAKQFINACIYVGAGDENDKPDATYLKAILVQLPTSSDAATETENKKRRAKILADYLYEEFDAMLHENVLPAVTKEEDGSETINNLKRMERNSPEGQAQRARYIEHVENQIGDTLIDTATFEKALNLKIDAYRSNLSPKIRQRLFKDSFTALQTGINNTVSITAPKTVDEELADEFDREIDYNRTRHFLATGDKSSTPYLTDVIAAVKSLRISLNKEQEKKNKKIRAEHLAKYLWEQMLYMKTNPVIAKVGEVDQHGNPVFHIASNEQIKLFANYALMTVGKKFIDEDVYYKTFNQQIALADEAILNQKTEDQQRVFGIHSDLVPFIVKIKMELIDKQPSHDVIVYNLEQIANLNKDKKLENLAAAVSAIAEEAFLSNENGYLQSKLYPCIHDVLMKEVDEEVKDEIKEWKKYRGKIEAMRTFFGIEQRKRIRAKRIAKLDAFYNTVRDINKGDLTKNKLKQEICHGIDRCEQGFAMRAGFGRVRMGLTAMFAASTALFAINAIWLHYAVGFAAATFFGFAIFSNPVVLPIILTFSLITFAYTSYKMTQSKAMKHNKEISDEHAQARIYDYNTNPYGVKETFSEKLKRLAKQAMNSLPLLCVLATLSIVLSMFVPGIFEHSSNILLSKVLGHFMVIPLLTMAELAIAHRIEKFGYRNNNKAAIMIGNYLKSFGALILTLVGVSGTLSFLGMLGIPSPKLPFQLLTVASLIVVAVVAVGCQLYTAFIDHRNKAKRMNESSDAHLHTGLYKNNTPTKHPFAAKSSMDKMMPIMDKLVTTKFPRMLPMYTKMRTIPGEQIDTTAYYNGSYLKVRH